MKKGKASTSAVSAAVFRALESIKPANERILYDPYAIQLLSGMPKALLNTRFLISGKLLNGIVYSALSSMIPGGINYVVVRARYGDDCLNERIDDGIEQLVLLGAGFDTRAFRFPALKDRIKAFEVDHPDSQRVKKERVKKIFGYLPDHVSYIPIDFEKMKLAEGLLTHGYDKNLKTLFIWEGVTMYITPEAVEETLAFVANDSGRGSSIIFDYIYQSAIDGRMKEAEKMRKRAAKAGESLKFAIEEGAMEAFLLERGFREMKDMSPKSLEDRYFTGTNRKPCPFFAIAHAKVKQ
jgi:methyltransferase (TIGR00027 family)